MPLPQPRTDESTSEFVSRCMGDATMSEEYMDRDQRLAVCERLSSGDKITNENRENMDGLTHLTALLHMAMSARGNENTLADIASITGDTRADIASIMAGDTMPGEDQINAIAEVLQIDESMISSAMELDGGGEMSEYEEMKSRMLKKSRESEKKAKIGFDIKNIDMSPDAKYATVEGYGSIFGNVDLGGDVVVKGAFTKTLKDKAGKVPFLEDHNYDLEHFLGVIDAKEDDVGLKCKIQVNLMREKGRDFYSAAKQCAENGMDMGLSIGYDIIDSEVDKGLGVLKLKQLRLNEISATLFPMNIEAKVTAVKSELKNFIEQEIKKIKSLLNEPSDDTHDEADLVQQINEIKSLFKS